jgi:ABC-type dipeptide/oligopeptide/nickel transport system permease component
LPKGVKWEQWRSWVAQIIANCPYENVNQRFWYGELRLGRLNKIYRWRKGHLLRGYSRVGAPSVYTELLSENFATLAVALGYIVIVLTAMQVGLATNHLQQNAAFQGASWIFTVISVMAPLVTVAAILIFFLVIFIANWVATMLYEEKRSGVMGVRVRKVDLSMSRSKATRHSV